jgi:arylsulfatase A-like enzyme
MPTLLEVAGIPVPETVTGNSLLPLIRNEEDGGRDILHGEHAGCYRYEDGMHYLTDGHFKYVWYSQTGREHLFNLDEDPDELQDIALEESADDRLNPWRGRLIEVLKDRPEGFTAGERLITGRPHNEVVPGVS